ncbi:hypothetical protein COOONC_07494 [Cooperia oncophora]
MNSHSTASVEIQTTQHPVPFIPPPGYYSEVMATDSSAMYPMYGLPGLQAPPPYPPPPSYSQIQNFPELPTVSNARLDNRTPSRNGKKSEITPVE